MQLTASEARIRFAELLDRVAAGEDVVITRYHRPVARMIAVNAPAQRAARRAVDVLRELRRGIQGRARAMLTAGEVRSAINAGRQ